MRATWAHGKPQRLIRCGSVLALAVLAATMLAAPQATWADERDIDEVAVEFVMTSDEVNRDEAIRRLEAQEGQTVLAERITQELGDLAAGAWLDRRTGELVINVIDERVVPSVREAGARPQLVRYPMSELEGLQARLDEIAAEERGAGGIDSWYIDVQNNVLVIKVSEGAEDPTTKRILEMVRDAGEMISIETSDGQLVGMAQNIYAGGTQIVADGGCSAGFAAKDAWNNRYMITASHCVWNQPNVSIGGITFGQRTYIQGGYDEAAIRNWYTWYWLQQPYVWLYNGLVQKVTGASQTMLNTVVCKSGITTGRTCGFVQTYGAAAWVKFGDGSNHWVSGLVQTNMCSKPGDSGGPVLAGSLAQGTISSGVIYNANGTPWTVGNPAYCGSQVGKPQITRYQPIVWTLYRSGLTLLI